MNAFRLTRFTTPPAGTRKCPPKHAAGPVPTHSLAAEEGTMSPIKFIRKAHRIIQEMNYASRRVIEVMAIDPDHAPNTYQEFLRRNNMEERTNLPNMRSLSPEA